MDKNYEYLYRKYKDKYTALKNSIKNITYNDLKPGMCVKGNFNPLYKDHLTRIVELCGKKSKTCVMSDNYITLMDGSFLSMEEFNKFYTIKSEGCPKNTDWDTSNKPGVISLHIDNQGFFFNVGAKAINKKESSYGGSGTEILEYDVYRISEMYRSDDDKVWITITNTTRPNNPPITILSNELKEQYFIVAPNYGESYNHVSFSLSEVAHKQKYILKLLST